MWCEDRDNAINIKCGVRIEIGNDHNTLFWYHIWATDIPLSQLATPTIPLHIAVGYVKEFWDNYGGW